MKKAQKQPVHEVIVLVLDSELSEWEMGDRCGAFYAQCFLIMKPLISM